MAANDKPAVAGFSPLRVELGPRSYDVKFYDGDVAALARDVAAFCPERAFVVTNPTIRALHGAAFLDALASAGVEAVVAEMEDGERYKTLATVSSLLDRLIEGRFTRRTCVVAFGGGVVGDVAGFVAAIFLRGVDYVQVPTTVVAMVDSSVGGKTGVDHPLGKNLIGAFYQPRLVAVNLAYLRTLDEHNLRGGFAEVIKYGVIRDPALFEFLESNLESALALDAAALWRVVRDSCAIKAQVVAADEREGGLRAILNYGHTFAHAIESVGAYRERQFHGQAVAIGMIAAAEVARRMGMFHENDVARQRRLIERAGLPTVMPAGITPDDAIEHMKSDKKVVAGRQRFVLPTRIGEVVVRDDVPMSLVREVLSSLCP
ncbi:MAG: 3-dehydroquinate synthase [Candidatus Sumerlaeaceae bacterium]|nr:3-dehydroquinate synthase [Candidatus Sumerlaeaceae bacterium]